MENKMEGIYCIEHIKSKTKYYGSSTNVEKRIKQHKVALQKQSHCNIHLQRAFNKYGISSFKFYLVEETHFNDYRLLFDLEQTYIDNNTDGYNLSPAGGGDCISNHPDNLLIREKIGRSVRERNSKMSKEELVEKYGNPGEKNGMYGRTHSEETKRKLSERHKGNTYAKGAIRSDEYKAKVSKRMKGLLVGDKNPFYGKKHSKETLEAISKWAKENSWIKDIDPSLLPYTKHYIITYPNGETKKVAGLKAISKEFNISIPAVHCTIKRMTRGILPTRSRSVFIGHLIEEV